MYGNKEKEPLTLGGRKPDLEKWREQRALAPAVLLPFQYSLSRLRREQPPHVLLRHFPTCRGVQLAHFDDYLLKSRHRGSNPRIKRTASLLDERTAFSIDFRN